MASPFQLAPVRPLSTLSPLTSGLGTTTLGTQSTGPAGLSPLTTISPLAIGAGTSQPSSVSPSSGSANQAAQAYQQANTSTAAGNNDTAYSYILAWLVFAGLLFLITRAKIGQTVVYYILALSVVFLLVTQYKFIAAALAPIESSATIEAGASDTKASLGASDTKPTIP